MSRLNHKVIAIALGGAGLLAIGAATFWQLRPGGCTQVRADGGGQEVTYSRGCINPQRYRKWTLTALR